MGIDEDFAKLRVVGPSYSFYKLEVQCFMHAIEDIDDFEDCQICLQSKVKKSLSDADKERLLMIFHKDGNGGINGICLLAETLVVKCIMSSGLKALAISMRD